jgi:hypothetical protein
LYSSEEEYEGDKGEDEDILEFEKDLEKNTEEDYHEEDGLELDDDELDSDS